jgi:hypothetical protein
MKLANLLAVMALGAPLCGCGLAGTATSTATTGASEMQQARDAKKIEAQVQTQLDQAQQAAAAQREAAEKDTR